MENLTDRLNELSNQIIWAADGCAQIPIEVIQEYNDLISLGTISAIEYFDAKAAMSKHEEEKINDLEAAGEYSEAIRRTALWRRQNLDEMGDAEGDEIWK